MKRRRREMRRSGAEGPQRGRYTCGTTDTNMTREEDLMKQVEELKRKIREVEKEKEEIRRRKEAMMRESGAGGIASRAIGSVMHVGLQGQEGMHVELQPQMVAADVNFFSGAGGSAMHVGLQGQEGMHVELQPQMVAADVNLFSGAGGSAMHVGLQGQEGMHVELQPQMVAAEVNLFSGAGGSAMHVGLQGQVDYHGRPLSEVSGSPEWLQTNHVEMPMFFLSEVPSAAPATVGTVFPTASVEGTARAPASDDGTMALTAASATSGTVPSAASVRGEVGGRESPTGTASSDAVAKALTGDTDVAYAGALLRPFDPGKRCHRGARMEKAVRGLDLPFDRGKTWRRMQHGG